MEGELYIVGTVYFDVASVPVLGRLLERLDPCAITVEISRFSVASMRDMHCLAVDSGALARKELSLWMDHF